MYKARLIIIVLFIILLVSLAVLVQNSLAQTNRGQTNQSNLVSAGTAKILINAAAPRTTISPDLYGLFYEEISRDGDGGLCAELVQNRDFEAINLPDGWRQEGRSVFSNLGWRTNVWFQTPTPDWSLVREGESDGTIDLEKANPLNEKNPNSLKMTATKLGGRIGVASSGYWGMNIQKGEKYDLSLYARTEGNRTTTLNFSLENEDGTGVAASGKIDNIGGTWKKYTLVLTAGVTNTKTRLVITQASEGTIWLDVVSLYPQKTYKGHGLRPDLCEMLAGLKPSFLRFPGGCAVEGASLSDRWNWKDSIGDISQRRGIYDLWGYYNAYGVGFHELLKLSEDLGAAPLYVTNVGMSCGARMPTDTVQGDDLKFYIQDTLDALEYAMGPVDSTWGAKRAANGHPAPFKIKYLEIGNENHGPVFFKNYPVFYEAIKAKYPQLICIRATQEPQEPNKPEAKEFVDEHYYESPMGMFRMANFYDNADRKGPKIYVGEYAVNIGVGQGNLLGALAEAVFMLNMEKNSDIVQLCSYAPLFENINNRNWQVNLIRFDSSRVLTRTSYIVQQLFGENKPDQILKTEVSAANVNLPTLTQSRRGRAGGRVGRGGTQPATIKQLYALAGMDNSKKELVVKVVNPTPISVNCTISVNGIQNPGKNAKVFTLGHVNNTIENTFENPNEVKPVENTISISGSEFKYDFSPNSLTILRIGAI
jgi:alpha-N-arabinofuranosidase